MEGYMRKALCCGINYAGTAYELHGCINDADQWAKFFGANKFDTAVLAEKQATRRTILLALGRLVRSLKPGDVGAFTYSGHGTWVPDVSGDEADGRDEAICPIDMGDDGHNVILDDELGTAYAGLVPGATLLVVFDSCHSGSAYRAAALPFDTLKREKRFINPAAFGHSPAVLGGVLKKHPAPAAQTVQAGLVYFAGCRDTEYSNDAVLDGRACGAFTHYAVPAFVEAVAKKQTYQDVYAAIRRALPTADFQQTPQLSATARLKATRVFA
jgi:hypothetical protein